MSVPVNWYDISVVPRNNGVRELSLDDYDDATRYPNIPGNVGLIFATE